MKKTQLDSFNRFDRTPTLRQTDRHRQTDTGPWLVPTLAQRRTSKNGLKHFTLTRYRRRVPGRPCRLYRAASTISPGSLLCRVPRRWSPTSSLRRTPPWRGASSRTPSSRASTRRRGDGHRASRLHATEINK